MRINNGMDFSFLFSNTSNRNSSMGSINYADYASIKNGSYKKLMNAYYGKGSSSVNSLVGNKVPAKDKPETKELVNLQEDSDSLKESADALLAKGSKSLFAKKDITTENEDGTTSTKYGYDTAAIAKGVKNFVEDYNAMVKSGGDAKSDTIVRQTNNMISNTKSYSKLLADVGITIGKDDQLVVDEKALQSSDMEKVKSLFNNTASYGYTVSSKASQINFTADREVSKASTYNAFGGYGSSYNNGDIFNTYF